MKLMRNVTSLLVASLMVAQSSVLCAQNVLADAADILPYSSSGESSTVDITFDVDSNVRAIKAVIPSSVTEAEGNEYVKVTKVAPSSSGNQPDLYFDGYEFRGTDLYAIKENLQNCLFTFTDKGDGKFEIEKKLNSAESAYASAGVDLGLVQSSSSSAPLFVQNSDGSFTITQNNYYFSFDTTEKTFEAIEMTDIPEDHMTSLYVYSYSTDGVNPIYQKVSLSEIKDGEQYILVAQDEADYYALKPEVGYGRVGLEQVQTAKITTEATSAPTQITFERTGVIPTEDFSLVIGNTTCNFNVVSTLTGPSTPDSTVINEECVVEGQTRKITLTGVSSDSATYTDEYVDVTFESLGADTYVYDRSIYSNVLASNYLYTFTEADGGYVIESASVPGRYLDIEYNSQSHICSENKQIFTVKNIEGTKCFTLTQNNNSMPLIFDDSLRFNNIYINNESTLNDALNRDDYVYNMYLYKKVVGMGSTELPGYERASSIENGGQYLIVAASDCEYGLKKDKCQLYILTNTVSTNSGEYAATVTDRYIAGRTLLEVTGKKVGLTNIPLADSNSLSLDVRSLGTTVDATNTIFQNHKKNKLSGITVTASRPNVITPDSNHTVYVQLSEEILNTEGFDADSIKIYTTDSDIIKFVNTSYTSRVRVFATELINKTEYICYSYKIGDTEYTYSIPVKVIDGATGTGLEGSYNIQLGNIGDNKVYYSINGAELVELKSFEAIKVVPKNDSKWSINFFTGNNEDNEVVNFEYTSDDKDFTKNVKTYLINSSSIEKTDFYNSNKVLKQVGNFGAEKINKMISDAKALGCTSAFTVTYGDGREPYVELNTRVDRLPEISITPYKVKDANGVVTAIDSENEVVANEGDVISMKVTIKNPADADFSSVDASISSIEGAYFTDSDLSTVVVDNNVNEISASSISGSSKESTYYVAFEIPEGFSGKKFDFDTVFSENYGTDGKNVYSWNGSMKIRIPNSAFIPQTSLTTFCETDIELPDGTTIEAETQIPVLKIYYVGTYWNSELNDFAGGQSVTNIKDILTTSGKSIKSKFTAGSDSSLVYNPEKENANETDYIVIYETEGDSSCYAIKIVAMAGATNKGYSVTAGGTMSMNYYVSLLDRDDAMNDAISKNYAAEGDYTGVDFSNIPEEPDLDKYSVDFSLMSSSGDYDRRSCADESAYGDLYYYSYTGIKAYDISNDVGCILFYDGEARLVVTSHSVLEYSEKLIELNNSAAPLFKALLAYGAQSQLYAYEHGWMNDFAFEKGEALQAYKDVYDSVEIDAPYTNKPSENCEFNAAGLSLTSGNGVSITFEFTLDESVDLSAVNMIFHSDVDDGFTYGGTGRDANGNIAIPGSDFVKVDGKDNTYRIRIKNVSPIYWDADFKFYLDIDGENTGVTFSVNSYCAKTQDDEALGGLVKAMYQYGVESKKMRG